MSTDLKYFDLITAKTMTTRTNHHCLTAGIPGTTWVSQYQNVKPFWTLLQQQMNEGLSGDNRNFSDVQSSSQITKTPNATTLFLYWLFCHPTNSVKVLKAKTITTHTKCDHTPWS